MLTILPLPRAQYTWTVPRCKPCPSRTVPFAAQLHFCRCKIWRNRPCARTWDGAKLCHWVRWHRPLGNWNRRPEPRDLDRHTVLMRQWAKRRWPSPPRRRDLGDRAPVGALRLCSCRTCRMRLDCRAWSNRLPWDNPCLDVAPLWTINKFNSHSLLIGKRNWFSQMSCFWE